MDTLSNKKHKLSIVINDYNPDVLIITEILPKNCETMPTESEYQIKNYCTPTFKVKLAVEGYVSMCEKP